MIALVLAAIHPRPGKPVSQYSCAQVRLGVSMLGLPRVLEIARSRGATPAQLRWATRCAATNS